MMVFGQEDICPGAKACTTPPGQKFVQETRSSPLEHPEKSPPLCCWLPCSVCVQLMEHGIAQVLLEFMYIFRRDVFDGARPNKQGTKSRLTWVLTKNLQSNWSGALSPMHWSAGGLIWAQCEHAQDWSWQPIFSAALTIHVFYNHSENGQHFDILCCRIPDWSEVGSMMLKESRTPTSHSAKALAARKATAVATMENFMLFVFWGWGIGMKMFGLKYILTERIINSLAG